MIVTILTENVAGSRFLAEHGLSYLIEIDDEKILFDTGHSDVFLKNAFQLGIDLNREVEKVVLSHGHWDHGDGLNFLNNKILITHPESFSEKFRKVDFTKVSLSLSKNLLDEKFKLRPTSEPLKITENSIFLGEIPRVTNFESQTTAFCLKNGADDFVPDDSAMIAISNNELVIITGCSHSGICNICEQAQKVTGIRKIKAVIGGFHLKHQNKQTRETIHYFKKNAVEKLYPTHCTDLPALALFYQEFNIQQVKTGMVFEF